MSVSAENIQTNPTQPRRSAWPMMQLGDCCEIVSGGTPKSSEETYWNGDILWATPKDLTELGSKYLSDTPRRITESGYAKSSANMLPADSVLFSSRAPIGHVAINTVPMCTNQGFKSFVPDTAQVVADYLYYWLRANKAQLQALGNGATFKEVSKAVISRVELPLPPLPEQRRIAAILDKADALRQKRRETITKLDQLLQSVFLEMFGDPVTNPMEWETAELSSVCDRIVDCPHSTPQWTDEGFICLRTSNIGKGRWVWDDTRYVTQADFQERTKRSQVAANDIILSREGTVGIAALVTDTMEVCMGQRLVQVRVNSDSVAPRYLLDFLLYVLAPERVGRLMVGSTSKHLNVGELRRLRIVAPSIELQRKYSARVQRITRLRRDHVRAEAASADLFASLQAKSFTGQL